MNLFNLLIILGWEISRCHRVWSKRRTREHTVFPRRENKIKADLSDKRYLAIHELDAVEERKENQNTKRKFRYTYLSAFP
jgi:hypothetical protein